MLKSLMSTYLFIDVLILINLIIVAISKYYLYKNKGEKGWSAFIPIYSEITQLKIIGMRPLFVLIYLIPGVNVIFGIYTSIKFVLEYDSIKFAVLSLFFPYVCYPILVSIHCEKEFRKNKLLYLIITLLFGCIGVNKLYVKKYKEAIISLLFCWTLIPFILSLVEFFEILICEKKNKDGMINIDSNKRSNVLFGASVVLFMLFVLTSIIPFESYFKKFTLFSDFNNFLSGFKLFGYNVFANLVAAPASSDAMGQTSGILPALGSWAPTDVATFLFIITIVLIFASKKNFDEQIRTITSGTKKILPIAITSLLVLIPLVLMVNSGAAVTISDKILGLVKGFNLAITTLASIVGSILISSFKYFTYFVGQVILVGDISNKYYSVIAFIMHSIYHFIMIFAPTSVLLVIGLYYLNIPYNKWLKYIWKVLLALFVIILIMSIIIFKLV